MIFVTAAGQAFLFRCQLDFASTAVLRVGSRLGFISTYLRKKTAMHGNQYGSNDAELIMKVLFLATRVMHMSDFDLDNLGSWSIITENLC